METSATTCQAGQQGQQARRPVSLEDNKVLVSLASCEPPGLLARLDPPGPSLLAPHLLSSRLWASWPLGFLASAWA